jgi:hypothetical protein
MNDVQIAEEKRLDAKRVALDKAEAIGRDKLTKRIVGGIATFVIVIMSWYFWYLFSNHNLTLPADETAFGTLGALGDFVGGLFNPLMAGAGLVFFIMTLRQNEKALRMSADELRLTRNELKGSSAAQKKIADIESRNLEDRQNMLKLEFLKYKCDSDLNALQDLSHAKWLLPNTKDANGNWVAAVSISDIIDSIMNGVAPHKYYRLVEGIYGPEKLIKAFFNRVKKLSCSLCAYEDHCTTMELTAYHLGSYYLTKHSPALNLTFINLDSKGKRSDEVKTIDLDIVNAISNKLTQAETSAIKRKFKPWGNVLIDTHCSAK